MSFLIGTAFGTAATTGALCMILANTFKCNPIIVGGAIISGCYFGDRCAPISSCTLLISQITETDIYINLKRFLTSCMPAFFMTGIIYYILGHSFSYSEAGAEIMFILECYEKEFNLHITTLFPVAIIIICTFAKIKTRNTIAISAASAFLIGIFLQEFSVKEFFQTLIYGYSAEVAQLKPMLNGGGIISMTNPSCIVLISSMYSGLFHLSGLLNPFCKHCQKIYRATNGFFTVLLASIFSCMVACNQPFGIILTNELTKSLNISKEKMAVYLANTSAILPPLFFWNIGATTTIASSNAPSLSPIAACFLYLVPIFTLALSFYKSQ